MCLNTGLLSTYAQDVVINEFSAGGNSTLQDEDGEYPDWIELQNISTNTINLGGWHLTDNAGALDKWTFPGTNLASYAFLVIFASNKNRAQSGKELHTNFKLDADGEYLALVSPSNTVISEYLIFPEQSPDISFGLRPGTIDVSLWTFSLQAVNLQSVICNL